jgi:hypothetical protein
MADDAEQSPTSTETSNSTSTYQYDHEPYDTFKHKIVPLAHSLGDFEDVSLGKAPGGSYNRVVIVRLTRGHETIRGILRIPRFTNASQGNDGGNGCQIDSEIQDQAAVLMYLALHNVPAPTLLAFDASAANHLGAPYVLQEFSTATLLSNEYGSMSLQQRLDIADSLAEFLVSTERIKFPKTGIIRAFKRSNTPVEWSSFTDATQPDLEIEVVGFNGGAGERWLPGQPPLADYLAKQLHYWHQKLGDPGKWGKIEYMWMRLDRNLAQMQENGFFSCKNKQFISTADSILYHPDLEPWNILVKRKQPATGGETAGWEIDKVIDWDRPLAVPAVLAREPPLWLWNVNGGSLTPDDQHVKERFETTFAEKLGGLYEGYNKATYLEEAYGKGRWIRRLARFGIYGASDSEVEERFRQFDKEWVEAFPELRLD